MATMTPVGASSGEAHRLFTEIGASIRAEEVARELES
jgi:hypothetical protein